MEQEHFVGALGGIAAKQQNPENGSYIAGLRKGARVVELARLESVCTGNGTAGSNPALSA